MRQTGAQIIVELLKRQGIELVAGIPGGSILPLYDELNKSSIRHVLVRHEQAAGFIAQGIARSTGRPAVCLATSGPGAMNLLTAIADARCDSVPVIAITGQVNTTLIGTDAFQEADTFGLSFPITKHSVMVKSPQELLQVIPHAFELAVNGRPGPVLIDVPRDVQLMECEFDAYPEPKQASPRELRFHTPAAEFSRKIAEIADALKGAKRPVLFCGGGCNSHEAAARLNAFLDAYRLPVVMSLMGLGSVPESSEAFIGMVGMHGSFAANTAIHDADVVLAAGVRFDDRATGLVKAFCPDAKVIHIDVDAAEVNKIIAADISLIADVASVFAALTAVLAEKNITSDGAYLKKIAALKEKTESDTCGRPSGETLCNPRLFISRIPVLAAECGVPEERLFVTTDVGQHQMWAAQYYPVERPRSFLTSGSLGTMGFGLPAAIGAALANPDSRVVCFSGDGSIMMNLQELATLAELNLPVTVIVFQNGTLGMVYQQQKYLFDKNYSASVFQKVPDLLAIARGFGIQAVDADSDPNWYKAAFDTARPQKPCFVRLSVGCEENVLPFVPGGRANIDAIRN